MDAKILIFLLTTLVYFNEAQNSESLFFPDDDGGLIGNDNIVRIPQNINLTQIRGTTLYENFVDRIISGGIAKLTLAINKILLQNPDRGSIVFAPVSVAGALALVLLGSNGKTFEEIISVMGLAAGINVQTKSLQVHEQFGRMITKLERTSGFNMDQQISFAAAVFVQNNYPIRDVYKKAAKELYESEILNVDFQSNPVKAQQLINNWVTDRTKGKIRDILGEAPMPDTRVIIASAMYFKASWEKPFFEGTTAKRPFYTNGRKSPTNINVEMMANGGDFPYFKDVILNCEIMGLPYKGNATTMYVVMPVNSDAQKLRALEERLTPSEMENLADKTVPTRAVLLFPKMKLESTTELKPVLQRLGVQSLFIPKEANLALLSPGEGATIIPAGLPTKIASNPNTPSVINRHEDIITFINRFGEKMNCSSINTSACHQAIMNSQKQQAYKKIDSQVGGAGITNRIGFGAATDDTIDNLRKIINQQSTDNNYQNPGLYAEKVLHKVYMDITETGTEAAASTSVSLSRDGGRVTFRVDVPFFFFIRHEETKTVLFWGSVTVPTPNFRKV